MSSKQYVQPWFKYGRCELGPSLVSINQAKSNSQTVHRDEPYITACQQSNNQVDAERGSLTLRQACSGENLRSAMCVQNLDDSRDIAIRITYRISLRSSSLWEPRHPSLKVVRYFVYLGCAPKPIKARLQLALLVQFVWSRPVNVVK